MKKSLGITAFPAYLFQPISHYTSHWNCYKIRPLIMNQSPPSRHFRSWRQENGDVKEHRWHHEVSEAFWRHKEGRLRRTLVDASGPMCYHAVLSLFCLILSCSWSFIYLFVCFKGLLSCCSVLFDFIGVFTSCFGIIYLRVLFWVLDRSGLCYRDYNSYLRSKDP